MKNINPIWVVNHIQYKSARGRGYGELRVLKDNGDGTFKGECKRSGIIYMSLNKDDFYFFEFV